MATSDKWVRVDCEVHKSLVDLKEKTNAENLSDVIKNLLPCKVAA